MKPCSSKNRWSLASQLQLVQKAEFRARAATARHSSRNKWSQGPDFADGVVVDDGGAAVVAAVAAAAAVGGAAVVALAARVVAQFWVAAAVCLLAGLHRACTAKQTAPWSGSRASALPGSLSTRSVASLWFV